MGEKWGLSPFLTHDDPSHGHPDARTALKDVSYFFIGNGLIQAAVQIAPSGEGTPIGLLIMDPERFGKKREALTIDPNSGLEKTMIRISLLNSFEAAKRGIPHARWSDEYKIPAVRVAWESVNFRIIELFYCPNLSQSYLIREIRIKNTSQRSLVLYLGNLKLLAGKKKLNGLNRPSCTTHNTG